jgi:hypothetical protein
VATFSYRRAHIFAVLLLCVLVVVCIGGLFLAGDLSRFQEAITVRESQAALKGLDDLEQLDQVLKQYPSNRVLKTVALANKDSLETDAAARRLLNEGEPRDLSKPIDLRALDRGELEALGRDLKTAESNAATMMPRYIALIKAERDSIEHDARPLQVGSNALPQFMAMIDEQHAEMTALVAKLLVAHVDYYGAYEKCVALLLRDFGIYKVVNGQFIFQAQSAADSYNAAAAAMAEATKRMTDLEAERAALRQSQLARWKIFAER